MIDPITIEQASKDMVSQLEKLLSKLAYAADSGLSTSNIENDVKLLAAKLKTSAELLSGLTLYKNVKGTEIRSWNLGELPDDTFMRYAYICKRCGKEQLELRKEDEYYFAEITKGVFVRLEDLPDPEPIEFKVKIEGNTLIAVRADLFSKLPESTKKLLKKEGDENDD